MLNSPIIKSWSDALYYVVLTGKTFSHMSNKRINLSKSGVRGVLVEFDDFSQVLTPEEALRLLRNNFEF